MEFRGTPGPWEWWTSNSFLRLSSRATGKDGDVIDSFKMSDGNTSLSVKAEDMHLIAAAPDLLEALQAMLSKAYKQNWNEQYPDEVSNAQDAINKALGEV
ncbi:MAG: hypothetical protein E6750_19660 [Atlantibacter hermannii]|uniref:hypothetical protein n=1 Tax=Atlantibacter hermannii TaxID=565 RepID=UPI0029001A46|nr:hypothetical protein [Atlantibacter hermannii]MDU1953601.1 hypothetical protein [Atlantibacter hermannii]